MFYIVRRFKFCIFFFILTNYFFSFVQPIFAQISSVPNYENFGLSSATLNAKTGTFIGGKNYDTVLPLASLTKLMTAVILAERNIDFNKKVVITEAEINYVKPYIEAGDITSQINLRVGDKVTINDLWHAMLIASSNEAAAALVANSGLSKSEFVSAMNKRAKSLGLTLTKFTEVSGIDPCNVGTAKEMAIIAQKAYSYPLIRLASAKATYKFKDLLTGRRIGIISRNNSLLAMKPLGAKVGYLTEAKINVAVRLRRSVKDRIVVILHAPTNATRNREINRLMLN